MKIQHAYCSACDRQVEVLVREGAQEDDGALPSDASQVVCLAYGEQCTGSMCPLFDVPTEQMKESFERQKGAQGSGEDDDD
jgi:hypothetical protein